MGCLHPLSMPQGSANILLQFTRVATEAGAHAEILPLLTRASIEQLGADAAAVVAIMGDQAQVVAANGLSANLLGWSTEAETIGPELGQQIATASGERFAQSTVRVLASGGSLFGALVLLFRDAQPVNQACSDLADGLADLAATAMSTAARHEQLQAAHAELRASQDHLVRTEKLRALGQMAAGVAHDLKNILSPISMHLQLLNIFLKKGDIHESQESIAEMQLIVRRGVETLERIRQFSQQAPETTFESVDLQRLLREAADISRPRMSSGSGALSRFREELGDPPLVRGKPGELVAALVNLIVNAIDALQGGGTITLRTREVSGGVEVDVSDDGPGMPPEVERQVFEPFFTTKGEAGTGLGLAMVYSCVQRHGGRISLVTAPQKGTTFTLWFPSSASSG